MGRSLPSEFLEQWRSASAATRTADMGAQDSSLEPETRCVLCRRRSLSLNACGDTSFRVEANSGCLGQLWLYTVLLGCYREVVVAWRVVAAYSSSYRPGLSVSVPPALYHELTRDAHAV